MPKMNVNESILIDASPEKIYPIVSNLKHWETWSPWVIAEPSANIVVAKDGQYHEWEGKIIGSGNLKILSSQPNSEVVMALTFLKPWKSKATTRFKLTKTKKGTKVEWSMESRLPFFLFWMKKQMEIFVGMDYQRGLHMLKDLTETGSVPSTLEFKGEKTFHATTYVGITTQCPISEISTHMERDYTRLMTHLMTHCKEHLDGHALSIYHKWEFKKDRVSYTACHPVHSIPENLPEDFTQGTLPKTRVYSIRHTGPYRHIGNAWSAGMMHQQAKVFKPSRKIHPMEVMYNSPKDTPENELISEVLFAVK